MDEDTEFGRELIAKVSISSARSSRDSKASARREKAEVSKTAYSTPHHTALLYPLVNGPIFDLGLPARHGARGRSRTGLAISADPSSQLRLPSPWSECQRCRHDLA